MATSNPNTKKDHLQPVSWQDQLSAVKETFSVPVASYASGGRKSGRRKVLKPTIAEAALQLNISKEKIEVFLKKKGFKTAGTSSQRIKQHLFVEMIKKFDRERYLKDQEKFERLLNFGREQEKKKKASAKSKTAGKKKAPQALPVKSAQRHVPIAVRQWIEVEWHEIIFEDYCVKFKFGQSYSKPFALKESRKSLRFLKKYIASLKLIPLRVLLLGHDVLDIENAQQLQHVVLILKVHTEFLEQAEKGNAANIKTVLENLSGLPVDFLKNIAKVKSDEVQYINYLSDLQDKSFKPVPAFEIIPNGLSFQTEDTFIFTISTQEIVYLVWESTVKGRATYVFRTDRKNYEKSLQAIFDYIASVQKAKRTKIRNRIAGIDELSYHVYITHSSFAGWVAKLGQTVAIPG